MQAVDEVTDEQILKSLLIKREKLVNELKRLNTAIHFFQPNVRGSVVKSDQPYSEQLENGEYSPFFSAVQQLHFALKHFGSANMLEVSQYIYEFDKRLHIDKLTKRLTDAASIEYRNGRLNGYKENRRYIYSLNELE
jgi:hypothetical protein